ncbi:carbohydrate ABC transporter permease [Xylanivirga thermophila]|uniref:carbohydrate ABC transporter permease n=1 Tax=Xylanivirga thermophila TaxID=2496273 RepID=UPI00101DDB87|nr:sugar ABC transporter permease [Xylanivirga thermophila]
MKKSKKAGILSAIIWGAGQIYNKQYLKGLIFLVIQILLGINIDYFSQGIWGLITLGEVASKTAGGKVIHGDNSIILLVKGIICLMILLIAVFVYILNIKDAVKTGKLCDNGMPVPDSAEYFKNLWDQSFAYIMLLPAGIFLLFLVVLPLIFGFCVAFTNYSSPDHLPPAKLVDWVGFENFKNIFKLPMWNQTFLGVLGWTVLWAVLSTFSCFFMGLIMAALINSSRVKFKKFWRTIYILPWAIPGMISLLVFRSLFNGQFGPINQILKKYGLIQQNIPWLSDPTLAKFTIIMVNLWLGFPYFMALMSSVMTSIDTALYEAAEIDGATGGQRFWHITIPLVLYSTAPLIIMSFAHNFNNFNVIYFLTEGNPINPSYKFAGHTDIFITWIYKMTLNNKQFSMASVMSILIFLIVGSISAWNFLKTQSFKEEEML